MNYLSALKNLVIRDNSIQKIEEILPLSTEPFECNSNECNNKFKESCFELNPADANMPLYETAQPSDLHFLVSTGKIDWAHDAFEETNTVLGLFNKKSDDLSKNCNIKIKCNATNESLNILDTQSITLNKLDVLVLPWFVWIKGITNENIDKIFEIIENIIATNDPKYKGKEAELLVSKFENLENVSVVKDSNQSYVLLCSHKTRDKKCGITAPIMKKEFDSQLTDLELFRDSSDDRPNGVKVMFTNHVGGHKFAANVMIYNKHGEFIWFARCNPLNVKFIINETILNHKVYPKNVRACAKFESIKW